MYHDKWHALREIRFVEELETLAAGTKPRTSDNISERRPVHFLRSLTL